MNKLDLEGDQTKPKSRRKIKESRIIHAPTLIDQTQEQIKTIPSSPS
jgi:hypothetical protein